MTDRACPSVREGKGKRKEKEKAVCAGLGRRQREGKDSGRRGKRKRLAGGLVSKEKKEKRKK